MCIWNHHHCRINTDPSRSLPQSPTAITNRDHHSNLKTLSFIILSYLPEYDGGGPTRSTATVLSSTRGSRSGRSLGDVLLRLGGTACRLGRFLLRGGCLHHSSSGGGSRGARGRGGRGSSRLLDLVVRRMVLGPVGQLDVLHIRDALVLQDREKERKTRRERGKYQRGKQGDIGDGKYVKIR